MKRCTHLNKHGEPCGNAAVRKGWCIYHQPDAKLKRLLHDLDRNQKEREAIIRDLSALPLDK